MWTRGSRVQHWQAGSQQAAARGLLARVQGESLTATAYHLGPAEVPVVSATGGPVTAPGTAARRRARPRGAMLRRERFTLSG